MKTIKYEEGKITIDERLIRELFIKYPTEDIKITTPTVFRLVMYLILEFKDTEYHGLPTRIQMSRDLNVTLSVLINSLDTLIDIGFLIPKKSINKSNRRRYYVDFKINELYNIEREKREQIEENNLNRVLKKIFND